METKEYRTIDKSIWPRGPWDDEPDKVQWKDEATGLPCIAKRSQTMGFWCGYVGVTTDHPAYEKNYDAVDVNVHGGLTYSDHCMDGDEAVTICHVPEPGEPDHVYWLGFDCAHAGDGYPYDISREFNRPKLELLRGDEYRTLEFVKGECASLAKQLKAMTDG